MNIIRGRSTPAPRRIIYGPPGVGKSTFACAEPGALALDYEDGLDAIGADRVKGARTWSETVALAREACTGPGEHRAVIVDTIDRLEDQATLLVCAEGKKKSLADFGYGDGYEALATKWRELLFVLEGAREHGRAVTLVAHVQNKPVDDPTMGTYGKYIATLQKRCWTSTHRWADAVLFANYEGGLVEGRAILTGARKLYTQAATGFDAKHRPNIASPLPLSWEAYAEAVSASQRTVEEILLAISKLTTKETAEKVNDYITKANGDVLRLASIESALRKKVSA
jgi:hypothetical protein